MTSFYHSQSTSTSCLLTLVGVLLLLSGPIGASESMATTASAAADNSRRIHVVAYKLNNKTESDGGGAYFELLRRIYQPHGYDVITHIRPIAGSMRALYRNQAQIMLADWHPRHLAREEGVKIDKLQAPRYPVDTEYVVALYPQSSPHHWFHLTRNPRSRIAWIEGYNYQYYLGLDGHPFQLVDSTVSGLRKLQQGELDAYVDDLDDVRTVMRAPEFHRARLRREIVQIRNLYPLFSLDERSTELMRIYDEGVAALIRSGAIFELYREFGLSYQRVKFEDPEQF